MNIRTENNDTITIVQIDNRLDITIANKVESELTKLIENGTKKLICDLSQTEYIASSGLRVILIAEKAIKKINGHMVLFGLNSFVQDVFATSGFDKLIPIYATEKEAIASFQ